MIPPGQKSPCTCLETLLLRMLRRSGARGCLSIWVPHMHTHTQHRSCDDLLPILLYVVIKSKLETVHTESMYMQDFIGTPPYHLLNVLSSSHIHTTRN